MPTFVVPAKARPAREHSRVLGRTSPEEAAAAQALILLDEALPPLDAPALQPLEQARLPTPATPPGAHALLLAAGGGLASVLLLTALLVHDGRNVEHALFDCLQLYARTLVLPLLATVPALPVLAAAADLRLSTLQLAEAVGHGICRGGAVLLAALPMQLLAVVALPYLPAVLLDLALVLLAGGLGLLAARRQLLALEATASGAPPSRLAVWLYSGWSLATAALGLLGLIATVNS